MKVSELKQVLERHGIDHTSCIEKADLVRLVKQIDEPKSPLPAEEKTTRKYLKVTLLTN